MQTGTEVFNQICADPPLSTGLPHLDDLLGGGVRRRMVTLIIGESKLNAVILQQIAFGAALRLHHLNQGTAKSILYVDGANRFNPYQISKWAASQGISPQQALTTIKVARAFNWGNMVEIVGEKFEQATSTPIDTILVSGFTKFFEDESHTQGSATATPHLRQKAFEQLNTMCAGFKRMQARDNTRIVLSTIGHTKSNYRPAGGNILTHFANVIVRMMPTYTGFRYHLDQHPFLPVKSISVNLQEPKVAQVKNTTLDQFL